MKKLMAALIAVGLLAGTASAQEVLSRNAVGYVKVDVPAGGFKIVASPFINFDGSEQTLEQIFSDIPSGTTLYKWNLITTVYDVYTYIAALGWLDDEGMPADDVVVERGDGIWIENTDSSALEIFIMGEVPGVDFDSEIVPLPPSLRTVSYAYPVEIDIEDAGLNPESGDTIYRWVQPGSYDVFTYIAALGWLDDEGIPASMVIQPGESFWYESTTTANWEQTKPYTWP